MSEDSDTLLSGSSEDTVTPSEPTPFLEQLPEDLRSDPSLADFKDIAGLAKSYIHSKAMVGADKVALPGNNATEDQISDFHKALGRPDESNTYELPEMPDDTKFEFEDDGIEGFRQAAHKAGLSQQQFARIAGWFGAYSNDKLNAVEVDAAAFKKTSTAELQKEFGSAFDAKLDNARHALRHFGGEGVQKILDQTGLGNHPSMVKMFADLGEAMREDTLPGDKITAFGRTPTQAKAEIQAMGLNKEFMDALNTAHHVGHAAAVEKWTALHNDAFPTPT